MFAVPLLCCGRFLLCLLPGEFYHKWVLNFVEAVVSILLHGFWFAGVKLPSHRHACLCSWEYFAHTSHRNAADSSAGLRVLASFLWAEAGLEGRLLEARPAQVADLSSWQGGVSSALRLCGSFLGSPWRPPPSSQCSCVSTGWQPFFLPGHSLWCSAHLCPRPCRWECGNERLSGEQGCPWAPCVSPPAPARSGTGGRQGPTLCECSFARARRRLPRLLSIFCLRFSTAVTFFIIFTGVCVFNFLYHFSSKTCIHSNTSQCRTI